MMGAYIRVRYYLATDNWNLSAIGHLWRLCTLHPNQDEEPTQMVIVVSMR